MSKSIKRFLLASVLSFATLGAALATEGGPTGVGDHNGHASAAPACGYECPVLATDGPGGINDGNGRSSAALSKGGAEFLVASIKGGSTGDFGH